VSVTGPIVVERRVRARPDQIWPYLTDGSLWTRWQGADATIDARPGGAFRMRMGDGSEASGSVLEVEPCERLTFTWGWTHALDTLPPGFSTVQIELLPDGDETVIRLTHRGLRPAARAGHEAGWSHYLSRLTAVSAGVDPGRDPGPPAPPRAGAR
jgi:uncharacterized protein YndB with AHSA1/START domain